MADIMRLCLNIRLVLILLTVVTSTTLATTAEEKPQIAIIGGGISGTTAAYHLRKEFEGEPARIDIYEPNKIGGRIASIDLAGRRYEVGATIIHNQNKYMYDYMKIFGLRTKDRAMSKLGLYDGHDYAFKESDWNAVTSLRLLWRYGFSLFRLDAEIYSLLSKFSRIYDLQERGYSFSTVERLLNAMDPSFVNMTRYSIREKLQEQEFPTRFIDELALAAMRSNYGQNCSINALVGYISLSGAQPGLWSIFGGNEQVPVHLSESSQSNIIKSWVKEIKRRDDGRFDVISQNDPDFDHPALNASTGDLSVHTYDIVVIATPLVKGMSDKIRFKGFEPGHKFLFPGEYQRTVVTMVFGEVNWPVLNLRDDGDLDDIITINADPPFNTLALQRPLDYTRNSPPVPHVWKLFSSEPLTDKMLDKLFLIRRETKVVDWLAYPKYEPPRDFLSPFRLGKRIYYTSGMEMAGSAMEVGAIAGRNVALLAHSDWIGDPDSIDALPKLKDEL